MIGVGQQFLLLPNFCYDSLVELFITVNGQSHPLFAEKRRKEKQIVKTRNHINMLQSLNHMYVTYVKTTPQFMKKIKIRPHLLRVKVMKRVTGSREKGSYLMIPHITKYICWEKIKFLWKYSTRFATDLPLN